ncbi:type VII secretion protein EccCb [Kutzneria buriramensis]|uniref:S-DNA-T family DNA segregation ATPase FtsK/SpoIIIE n=1 Tax=Kutzneria buriramensis TaxID=1045776 RepID=A0A3E0I0K6_9PSEU|nr:type VII secretion protein EccCb [Kutzneria buriramensis]REH52248.1 S-DNA-T family DNA segregation ATPase FtsK/SpoIIIE [Kutzneria buriramensis]
MGRRLALLVATSTYGAAKLHALPAPAQEAPLLARLLQDDRIGAFDEVHYLVNAHKSEVERNIEDLFRDRDQDDLVLLHISGHGLKNDHDRLFFATSDTNLDRLHSTAVSATLVHQLLEECDAQAKVVLLDCCFSGVFPKGLVPKGGGRVDVRAELGHGTYVITASDDVQEYAFEGRRTVANEEQSYSRFTDAVINGLSSGAADVDEDGQITASDLYRYLYDQIKASGRQTPKEAGDRGGSCVIAWRPDRRLHAGEQAPLLDTMLAEADDGAKFAVPIGLAHQVDRRSDGVRRLDLAGQDGHVAVVGRIQSGKSTLVHTLMAGLAHNRTPAEVSFYCLGLFSRLGHVRAVAASFEAATAARLLTQLESIINDRAREFRQRGIHGAGTFRELRRRGMLSGRDNSDVFLIIDGWEQFALDVADFVPQVARIASRGLDHCVHVVVTARSWSELPPQITALLRGRIELALDDPRESKISPELAATLPDEPGWGLHGRTRFVAALPWAEQQDFDYEQFAAEPAAVDPLPALGQPPTLLHLLGVDGTPDGFDLATGWQRRTRAEQLRVAFGVDELGQPVVLDIKEAAEGGMGPHGLCIGATGSGKSELLRTLTTALMVANSPEDLNLLLIDFKGGATFLGLEQAPHVTAVVTNLVDDLSLVDRMRDALAGEVARRQEALAKAGNCRSLWEYQQARRSGQELAPLPVLLVCVDEFSELLTAKPDFLDVFVQIGRVGRSLGVHLLLSSQRLEEGRLRGLDTYLSYRIGLRTFSAVESRSVLGVPDAYELPPIPGSGYLAALGEPMTRFKAAYVSQPTVGGRTELEAIVERMAGQGTSAHQIWLPPLTESPSLDMLLPRMIRTPGRGLFPQGYQAYLQVPLGLVDKPFEQRRDLFWADFSGAAGHAAVVGGPQSGKSMLLRTLIMSLSLTHTPRDVQFYALDLGGGSLAALEALPHVGGVASRLEPDKAHRIVAELANLVADRERLFRENLIDGMVDFRRRHGDRAFSEHPYGDVFLIIDGWLNFRQEFEALEQTVMTLLARGLQYGVHVVVTANRWAEIRPAAKDLIGTRLELRLGDPSESEIDRRTAATVPAGQPGRGLTSEKLHFVTALPRIDASSDGDLHGATQHAVATIAEAWGGPPAPPVRLLPELLPYQQLPQPTVDSDRMIPIGVDQDRLAPVFLNFDGEPHFCVFGDGESGKTNLLRTIVRGIMTRYTTSEAVVMLVDYRRTLLGFVDTDHLLAYAVSGNQLTDIIGDVTASLKGRLPGPDVTQEQLRSRTWWRGPEVFVVVDDYDLVVTQGANPLLPLAEFLPQAKDVGLHLVVARRSGGASRALFDPVIGKLREIATSGMVLSCSPDEGVLLGSYKPQILPPGRGALVTRRRGQQLIQTARLDAE